MSSATREELLQFFDYAGEKGLMKVATATSYRVACKSVLSILDDVEASDVSSIDIEDVFHKFQNLNSTKFTPRTLRDYKTRVKTAIKDFLAYKENPANWKPSGQQRARQASTLSGSRTKHQVPNTNNSDSVSITQPEVVNGDFAKTIVHKFPLRADTVVTVSGIPFDVKKSEMARFTAFLSNLVAEGDERPFQPALPLPQDN